MSYEPVFRQPNPPDERSIWANAQFEVGRLIREVRSGRSDPTRFERVHDTLRSLPIPIQKIAILVRRSHNAETYHNRFEKGATVFELNLVLGQLKNRHGYVH